MEIMLFYATLFFVALIVSTALCCIVSKEIRNAVLKDILGE